MRDGTRGCGAALPPVEALALFVASAAALQLLPAVLATTLSRMGTPGALIAIEVLCVLAPVLLALRAAGVPLRSGLGLRRPGARALLGALLAGGGGFYLVAGAIEPLMDRVAPLPPSLREELRALLLPPGGPRALWLDLLALSLAPAICEEVLFRGALLRAWVALAQVRADRPAGWPVAATALAFGLFHFSLYKLLPTTLLGALLALIALRGGSILASVVAHALNNALVVVLVRAGYETPPGASGPAAPFAFALAVLLLVGGLALCAPAPSENGGGDGEVARAA